MLRVFVILSSFLVSVRALGEFTVLSSPKSLLFKGDDELDAYCLEDVLSVSMGYPFSGQGEWKGLYIDDPFNLARNVFQVVVDGTEHISLSASGKTFKMRGNIADDALNWLNTEVEQHKGGACDINFNHFDEAIAAFEDCFGSVPVLTVKDTNTLSPSIHSADKQFLQSLLLLQHAASNIQKLIKPSNLVSIRLSLDPIAQVHGAKSESVAEASKLISNAIANLNAAVQKINNGNTLVVVIANRNEHVRSKRATTDTQNLAEYYNEDYPVIFNIILWFMIAFGLSLLAIVYAIGAMDPGRDSIIYRMTSTRMKKDN